MFLLLAMTTLTLDQLAQLLNLSVLLGVTGQLRKAVVVQVRLPSSVRVVV